MYEVFPPEEAPTSPCLYYAYRQVGGSKMYWGGPGIGLSNFPYKVFTSLGDGSDGMSDEDFSSFLRAQGPFVLEAVLGDSVPPLPAEVAGKMYHPGEEFEGR